MAPAQLCLPADRAVVVRRTCGRRAVAPMAVHGPHAFLSSNVAAKPSVSERKVYASAYAGSLPAQVQQPNEVDGGSLWQTLLQLFGDAGDRQQQPPTWDGIPPEYLTDDLEEHGGWTHSHIAERLVNESSSSIHRAFDRATLDL